MSLRVEYHAQGFFYKNNMLLFLRGNEARSEDN